MTQLLERFCSLMMFATNSLIIVYRKILVKHQQVHMVYAESPYPFDVSAISNSVEISLKGVITDTHTLVGNRKPVPYVILIVQSKQQYNSSSMDTDCGVSVHMLTINATSLLLLVAR